jgi:CheY-like chemotaxis protein
MTVVVVDDVEDVRALLRMEFALDGRFTVVGEGADGAEAIELARTLQPDLIVLDCNMPRVSGLEAIGPIREVAPSSAVVLYTASADVTTHHAALAAGALDVLEKASSALFVERLTNRLLDRTADPHAAVHVQVGPVPGAAARIWTANTLAILAAVGGHPEIVDVPVQTLSLFTGLVRQWQETAADADEFLWMARAPIDEVARVVEDWAVIDAMTDDQLTALGVRWSPPEGQPFFEALTEGVLCALRRHDETERLADRLAAQWAAYREASAAG